MSKRVITLGTWEGKPIEWIVLKEDRDKALVITKSILFNRSFDNQRSNNGNMWNNCRLREYLNNEFFNLCFNESEKKRIMNTKISGEEFPETKDDIFVLSCDEALHYFNSDAERVSTGIWSLRSKHLDGLQYTSHVDFNGLVKNRSSSSTYTDHAYGIRPAMYMKL
ncbi:MAG: DUF6273 domain-containing protein [Oscillospiraceae bacterium]|nr:DUF6273 domain-containing protein [Oscillospiraceae bacterium]